MEKLASYVRLNRPQDDGKLEYERMIRLCLNWLDTHKIKEKAVFQQQEGKEYASMLNFLEERLGRPPDIPYELFQIFLSMKYKWNSKER